MTIFIGPFWGGFVAGVLVTIAVMILLAMWAAKRKARELGGK